MININETLNDLYYKHGFLSETELSYRYYTRLHNHEKPGLSIVFIYDNMIENKFVTVASFSSNHGVYERRVYKTKKGLIKRINSLVSKEP